MRNLYFCRPSLLASLTTTLIVSFPACDALGQMESPTEPVPANQSPLIQPDRVKANEIAEQQSTADLTAQTMQPKLLREGSFLAGAAGRLARDKKTGGWKFVVQPGSTETLDGAVAREFVLLPCAKLSQMEQSIASTDLDIIFEMTGRIHVFEGRNYLLPLSAPRVQQYVEQIVPEDENNDSTDNVNNENAEASEDLNGGEDESELSTEEMIEQLRSRVPVNRSLTPAPPTSPNATIESETPDLMNENDRPENLQSEGEFLLRRRGSVSRLSSGAWIYRFVADSTGLSDPPMVLLPCLLLERIQRELQNSDPGDNFVMSGEVLTYHNQNYLLPTAYHILRTDKNLHR